MNALHHAGTLAMMHVNAARRLGLALLLAVMLAALTVGGAHAQAPSPDAGNNICLPSLLPLSGRQARAVNSEPALDNTGSRAVFWSTANPQGINADGSIEVFSANMTLNEETLAVDSTIAQVTESRGNILGGFNIMPDIASAVLGGSNNAFTIFASDRDLAPRGGINNADGGFEIFLARRIGDQTVIAQLTNTRRSASILPSISNLYPEDSPRYANIAFVSDADDKGIVPRGQADNANYEVYVMQLDLSVWPPLPVGGVLQVTQTPNDVNNDKPAISLGGNAVVFLSDAIGPLRPGATVVADNADRNREVFRAIFSQPNPPATITFRQVTKTGATIVNDFPDSNADGSQIVYSSTEKDFSTTAVNAGNPIVYVSNLSEATPSYLALSSSLKANPAHPTTAREPAINGRGDRIVFAADACDPDAPTCTQPAGQYQVFAADQDLVTKQFLVAQVTTLMTTTHEAPAISGDGRFIALVTSEGSAASNPDLSGSEVAILFCPVARLEPIKTVDTISPSLAEDRPDVGDLVDYVVTLNNGSLTSFDGTMVLTDTLPPQVAYTGTYTIDPLPTGSVVSPVAYNSATRHAVWTVEGLPRGQKATVRLRVKVLASVNNVPTGGQTVTNIVNMTTTAPVKEIQNGLVKIATEATADLRVTRVDLSAALNISTQIPREQTPFFVTLVVTNSMPGALDPATNVRLTTTLPSLLPNYTIGTPSVISGTYTAATGVWLIPRLDAGKSARLQFTVTPNPTTGGTPPRTVAISAPTSDQQDFSAANNIVGPSSRSFRVLGTDLELVSKTVNKTTPPQFSDVTYTIVLRNNGPTGPLTDAVYVTNKAAFVPNIVEVSDPLPAGLNFFSASDGGTLEGGTVVWRLPGWGDGIPAPNDVPTYTVSFTAKVQAAPGTRITNTVSSVQGRLDSPGGPVMPDQSPGNNAPASIFAAFTTNQAAAVNLQIKPQPGQINEGQQVTLTVRYSDPDALDSHVVAVNWGDSTPNDVSNQPINAVSTREVTFLHVYGDDNTNISDSYSISVTVTDNNGSAAQKAAPVVVNNVLPVSTGLTVTQSAAFTNATYIVRVGETLGIRQALSDPGFTRAPLSETFTYIIDWGGGAIDASKPVTSVVQGSPGVLTRGTINAAHTYNVTGTYTVRVLVSDDDQTATAPIGTVNVIVTVRPVAVDDTAAVDEDGSVPITVTLNDTGDTIKLFSATNPVTGTIAANPVTGVITFTAAGRFDYLKQEQQAQDFFNYTIRDQYGFTANARVDVTVTGINDLPVLDLNGAAPGVTTTVAFKEDFGSKIIAPSLLITDPDDLNMQSAVVLIQNPLDEASERLLVTPVGGISAVYSTTTGLLTLTGSASKADYRTTLGSVAYTNTSQNPITTTRQLYFEVTDGQGEASSSVTASVTVERTDDAPVVTTSAGPTDATEGGPTIRIDPAITITDVDISLFAGGALTVTVQAGESRDLLSIVPSTTVTLTLPNVFYNGVQVGTVFGSGTNQLVVTLNSSADVTATQAVAQQVAYTRQKGKPPASTTKDVAFTVRSSAGGAPSNTATKNITLTLVNDAPVITFGSFPQVFEETAKDIRSSFTVTDVDTTGVMRMIVSVANGRLTYTGPGVVTNNGAAAVTVDANAVQLNQAATLTYTGNLNFFGDDTLTVSVNDNDVSTTAGPTTTVTNTVFAVTNVNDAPTLALAAVPNANEDTPLSIGSLITINDVDAAPAETATFTATVSANGRLTISPASPPELTVTGSGSSQVVVKGSLTNINTWLGTTDSLLYQGVANFNGSETLTVRYSDGSLVAPANLSAPAASRTFTVAAENDAPTLTLAPVPDASQGVPLSVGGLITIGDVDAIPSETATLTATVSSNGNLTVNNAGTLIVTGSGSSQVVVKGNLTNISAWKEGANALVYQSIANYIGAETLTVRYEDGSLVTPGSRTAGPVSQGFSVAAVNDPPVVTIAPIHVNQDVATNIHPQFTVADADSPSTTMRMTVTVQSGTLSYTGTVPSGSGSGTNRLVLVGTLAQLNDQGNVINYLSPLNAYGVVSLTVSVNDGDPLPPGPQTGTATGSITINAAPVLDLNGAAADTGFAATFTENGPAVAIVANTATVFDIDSSSMLSATVQNDNLLDNGSEILTATVPITMQRSYDASAGRLTLAGSASKPQWEEFLRTVTYRNTSENPTAGDRTINFQIFDDGAPPLGSALAVATVSVVAVNDAPVLDLNGVDPGFGFTATYTENGPAVAIVANTATVFDIDSSNMLSATVQIDNLLDNGSEILTATVPITMQRSYDASAGRLTLAGSASKTQWETILRTVTYRNTSENPTAGDRTINFQIFDNAAPPLGSAIAVATVAVVAENDAPTVSANTGLTVTQAATATTPVTTPIANAMLAATDVDDVATAIIYTVQSVPISGTLKLNNAPLTVCATVPATSTFTQQQLNDGLVKYVTALGAPPLNGSFTFVVGNSLSCGGAAETFTITVNAP